MRKYFLFVIFIGLMSAMVLTSCKKEESSTFPLKGTAWIGESFYDLVTNRYYNGDIEYILRMTGEGTGTMLVVDNHTNRALINITGPSPVTWSLQGEKISLTTGSETMTGDLSYSNENINFLRSNSTYLAFDKIAETNALSTKVFRGTFKKVGTTTTSDVVWIFISGKGFKMIVPGYPVTMYPLSKYSVDTSGKVLVDFFGGQASSSIPIDYTNHGGNYTVSNDSLVYTTTNVPAANTWMNGYNWRGVFRLKEVK
jgi:hypothetical protein